MAQIFVYHASDRIWDQDRIDVMMGFKPDHGEKCATLLAQGGYDLVALLTDEDNLDQAYYLTNHIDDGWHEPEVLKANHIQLGSDSNPRSSSVGDIMVVQKEGFLTAYVVSSFGFTDITASLKAAFAVSGFSMAMVTTCPDAQNWLLGELA